MTPSMIRCPNCQGSGRIQQFVCYSTLDGRAIYLPVACTFCSGTGRLRSTSKKAQKWLVDHA